MKNKIIVLLLIVCCFLLSSCEKDGTSIVKNAYQNMNTWENYSFSMQTMADVNLPAVGHVKLVSASDGTTQLKPTFLLKMDSNIAMQKNEENENVVALEQYVVEQDGNISIYQNSQGVWQKNIVSSSDEMASIKQSPADIMKIYINAMTDADIVDEEIINDVPCLKVKVTLSFDALSEIINNFNLAKIFGLNEEIAASLDTKSEINTILWIGKETAYFISRN